jgi:hypothetical protein
VKFIAVDVAPLHKDWFDIAETVGVGLTVMVKVWTAPAQPRAWADTLITPAIGLVPLLVPENALILPEPMLAKPMLVLLLNHV